MSRSTERLYHRDSLLLGFEASVLGHGSFGGRPSVILDQTAFYPEAGGQMADRGVLSGASVEDVQEADGTIHHLVSGDPPAVGTRVQGRVDARRRRLFMALHTGQHILSRAVLELAGADTLACRLGETDCTIDVKSEAIADGRLQDIEALANTVIDDDAPVRAFFPDEGELAELALRRLPKVSRDVRVVKIGDFDVAPCGGTHCTHTSQVGLLRVQSVERYKGGLRVHFSAGQRARAELLQHDAQLRALAREFRCRPPEVSAHVSKLRREWTEARGELSSLSAERAARLGDEAVALARAAGEPHVVLELEGVDAEVLRGVAATVTRQGFSALLAAPSAEGCSVVLARAEGDRFDCAAFLKRVTAQAGGRGGGRPERAEGRLPAGTAWVALARGCLSEASSQT
jgi:alanyl-tRNA synthetase